MYHYGRIFILGRIITNNESPANQMIGRGFVILSIAFSSRTSCKVQPIYRESHNSEGESGTWWNFQAEA